MFSILFISMEENKPKKETTCLHCNKKYFIDRSKGHRANICGTCNTAKRRKSNKTKLLEIKGGKCIVCGYNKHHGCLTFHHIDPSKKEFTISDSNKMTIAWEKILEEVDKCALLCHNCHGEVHAKLIDLENYL